MPHDSAFSIPSGRRTAQTLIVYVEDQPGTLNRIVSLFRRRGFNIESLTVGRSEREGISRITVVVRADDETARRLEANLYKLVNVLSVEDVTHAPSVTREMAFVKVRAAQNRRPELLQLVQTFRPCGGPRSRVGDRRDHRDAGEARRARRGAAPLRDPRAGAHRSGGDAARTGGRRAGRSVRIG